MAFYYIAIKKADELDLNDQERRITVSGCVSWLIVVMVTLLSVVLVHLLPGGYALMGSGFIFWLIPLGIAIANRQIMGGTKSSP